MTDDIAQKLYNLYRQDIANGMEAGLALEIAAHRATLRAQIIAPTPIKEVIVNPDLVIIKEINMDSAFKSLVGFSLTTTDVANKVDDKPKMVEMSFRIDPSPSRPDLLEITMKSDVYTQTARLTKGYVERMLEHLTLMHKVMNNEDFC